MDIPVSELFAIQDVPGKGKGLIAVSMIPQGTRILSEKPIIRYTRNDDVKLEAKTIFLQIQALDDATRNAFLLFDRKGKHKNLVQQYLHLVHKTAVEIGSQSKEAGVFLNGSYLNHDCSANAQRYWNDATQIQNIHALRDIEIGEEITLSYLSEIGICDGRLRILEDQFNFICTCSLCCLSIDETQEFDNKAIATIKLDSLIKGVTDEERLLFPLQILRYIERRVELLHQIGPTHLAEESSTLIKAAQVVIEHGDLARGKSFIEGALIGWRMAFGDDCREVTKCRELIKDPYRLDIHNKSIKWKSNVEEIPVGLDMAQFDSWLWRRREPAVQSSGTTMDLRDQDTFPGWSDLPDEKYLSLEYYHSQNITHYRPRRHWCFLGEIVDSSHPMRRCLNVQDVTGRVVSVQFYTDCRGQDLETRSLTIGNTVMILYAHHHGLSTEIRIENLQRFKTFPMRLNSLLELSDRLREFSGTLSHGERKCHGCGQRSSSLTSCSKCYLFWYCNEQCQRVGWRERGHKLDCRHLGDLDLRRLFLLNWESFEDYINFPLLSSGPNLVSSKNRPEIAISVVSHDQQATISPKSPPTSPTSPTAADTTSSVAKSYVLKHIKKRNSLKGFVATKRISKGSRILLERALFLVPRDNTPNVNKVKDCIDERIELLNENQKKAFFDLKNAWGESDGNAAFGIVRTNALPLGQYDRKAGLFLEASNFNHSCKPNAHYAWNHMMGHLTVHALQDIEVGAEITISYLFGTWEYAERQAFLKRSFKFHCQCVLCALPREQRVESDIRLKLLTYTEFSIARFIWDGNEENFSETLRQVRLMLNLLDQEAIRDAGQYRAYVDAYKIALYAESYPRARVFAKRAYEFCRVIEGDDGANTETMREALDSLCSQPLPALDDDAFENWLWMINEDY